MVLLKSKTPVSTTKKEVSVTGSVQLKLVISVNYKVTGVPCQVGLFKKSPSEKSSIN